MIAPAKATGPDALCLGYTMQVQQLFVRNQSAIKAFILSLQPDFVEADDILQEVFLTVTQKAAEFRPGSSFTAWAFAIARFKVLEAQRRRQRKGADSLSEEIIELLAAEAPDEGFFESRLSTLRGCLDRLAPRAREIIRLRYYGEHGPEAIAQRLVWTANAVNVALSKARMALRHCVEQQLKRS
jgi:RNA polymerase sigma-70 factor (ECF subfamily)